MAVGTACCCSLRATPCSSASKPSILWLFLTLVVTTHYSPAAAAAAKHHHRASHSRQTASRSLISGQPPPEPYPVESLQLPAAFKQTWTEAFPQQWQAYQNDLLAVHVVGASNLLEMGKALLPSGVTSEGTSGDTRVTPTSFTQLNPTQLRRSLAYMGGMHRLRR